MKAITTKYFGPTNTRGSRIKAFDSDNNSVTIPYPSKLSGEAVHEHAAQALVAKMNWGPVKLHGGAIKSGYVFVMENTTKSEG